MRHIHILAYFSQKNFQISNSHLLKIGDAGNHDEKFVYAPEENSMSFIEGDVDDRRTLVQFGRSIL